jgi:hypothetical protein
LITANLNALHHTPTPVQMGAGKTNKEAEKHEEKVLISVVNFSKLFYSVNFSLFVSLLARKAAKNIIQTLFAFFHSLPLPVLRLFIG